MNRAWLFGASAFALALAAAPAAAQIQAAVVAGGFTRPVYAAAAPGAPRTLYVAQQGGAVRTVNADTGTVGADFFSAASLPDFVTGGERGLLGLAFHPDYAANGVFYAQYTVTNGTAGGAVRVDQFTNTAGVIGDRRTVIQYDDRSFDNHNAGWIGFNPVRNPDGSADTRLYIPTGDGGDGNDPDNNAQNLSRRTGKILRFDVGGGLSAANPTPAPAGNPSINAAIPELYAYGLRNPYRASFDRATGDLYIGDVGQGAREEVNVIRNGSEGGQNFGWRVREGDIKTPGVGDTDLPAGSRVDPLTTYAHDDPRDFGRSVTGGYVYRGSATDDFGNPLDGTYIFGDFVSGRVLGFKDNPGTTPDQLYELTGQFGFDPANRGGRPSISSFAEDGVGDLYLLDYGSGATGRLIRLAPVPEPATALLAAAGGLAVWRRARPRG